MTSRQESYCGLCDHCQLGSPDFQAAAVKVKTSVDRLPAFWPRQGLQAGPGVSPKEFHRGPEWFLGLAQCPGCKEAGGLKRCDISSCAQERQQDHEHNCSDYESCRYLILV